MRIRTLVPIGMLVLVAGCGSAGEAGRVTQHLVRADVPRANASVSTADAAALRDGNAQFAGKLLATVARARPNVALSPASISEALSMAFAGARGTTASEMARPSEPGLDGSSTGDGTTDAPQVSIMTRR